MKPLNQKPGNVGGRGENFGGDTQDGRSVWTDRLELVRQVRKPAFKYGDGEFVRFSTKVTRLSMVLQPNVHQTASHVSNIIF